MKALIFSLVITTLTTTMAIAQKSYELFGSYGAGISSPVGGLSNQVDAGWNIDFEGVFPLDQYVGVGPGIQYSTFPYKSAEFDGRLKVLFIRGNIVLGTFAPSSRFIMCGLLGAGYPLLFIPTQTLLRSFSFSGPSTISSHIDAMFGFGFGAFVGYRFGSRFGISGRVQYDIMTKFKDPSLNYLSFKIGVLVIGSK